VRLPPAVFFCASNACMSVAILLRSLRWVLTAAATAVKRLRAQSSSSPGASGYGLYTTLFQHFMADNMSRYGDYLTLTSIQPSAVSFQISALSESVMGVTLKQIFGQIIWVSGFMTFAFLLLDISRVRTGIEKVPYWPVYGIKMLSRLRTE